MSKIITGAITITPPSFRCILKQTMTVTNVEVQQKSDDKKWFAGINSIRFILALIVVLSHCPNPLIKSLKESGRPLLNYAGSFLGVSFVGIVAVIAFFIISGFVIHYPNRNGIGDIKRFYIKRGLRVLIPLLVIKLLGFAFGSPENVVVWSLYCELLYYGVYPLLTYAKKISWKVKTAGAYAIAVIIILIYAGNEIQSMVAHRNINYNGDYAQFGITLNWLIGLPCWLLGVLLAERINSLNREVLFKEVLFYRILLFFLAAMCSALRYHFYVSYIISITLFLLPIAKWVEIEICYYKKNNPLFLLEKLGKFSYSLYLCHPLAIVVLLKNIPLNNYTYMLYIISIMLLSYLFFVLFENPSHLLAKRLSRKKNTEV